MVGDFLHIKKSVFVVIKSYGLFNGSKYNISLVDPVMIAFACARIAAIAQKISEYKSLEK